MNCVPSSRSQPSMIRHRHIGDMSHRVSRIFLWCRVAPFLLSDEITNAHAVATLRVNLRKIAITLSEQVLSCLVSGRPTGSWPERGFEDPKPTSGPE